MMKKEFLRDDNGKVRNCPSTVAKMNLFEVIRYTGIGFSVDVMEYLKCLAVVLVLPIYLVFFPITILVSAYVRRRRDRKFCQQWSEENRG